MSERQMGDLRVKRGFWQLVMILALGAPGSMMFGQTAKPAVAPDPLFQTVASLDKQLFDAYNHCDLQKFRSLLADDVEFYHDLTGLMVGGDKVTDAIKQNICGKVTRQLLPGTLEVYPIKDYGAVEIGIHRFHHPGHPNEGVGEAKFIHVWQNKNGSWKITRVLSIDHHSAGD
jgi:Domain of unknown function (DUF4440)